MSSLLVKDSPPELNDWLKAEARLNRRSLGQQVLICLEWCMRTYGEARSPSDARFTAGASGPGGTVFSQWPGTGEKDSVKSVH